MFTSAWKGPALQWIGNCAEFLGPGSLCQSPHDAGIGQKRVMKEAAVVLETPLIGSGSQEEADNRVRILLELGTSRGFLTYEELNEKLPDEVVSPDKLDSLLMRIDEMGIKLIDEQDIGEYVKQPKVRVAKPQAAPAADGKKKKDAEPEEITVEDMDGEEIDLNLEETLNDSVLHLAEVRKRREEQKLIAQLRRTDAQLGEQDEVSLLKKLAEQSRTPNLRRVGS